MASQRCLLLIVEWGVLLRFVDAKGNDHMEKHAPYNNEMSAKLDLRGGRRCAGVSACKCKAQSCRYDLVQHHHNVLQENSCTASCPI